MQCYKYVLRMYANVNGGYIEAPPCKGWLSSIRKMCPKWHAGSIPVIRNITYNGKVLLSVWELAAQKLINK